MTNKPFLFLVLVAFLGWSDITFAANPTQSMTGTVLAITAADITIQSGADVWVIKRDTSTKISGDAKVGATVTVTYSPTNAQKKEGGAT